MSDSKSFQAAAHSIAGALGGVISLSTTYPLFIITTRMSVQARENDAYKSFLDAVVRIVKNEGWTALFSGLTSGIVGVAVTQGVYYYWYEFFKASYSIKRSLTALDNILIASSAGVITVFATNPIWTINTKMAVNSQAGRRPGAIETFFQILKTDGVKGLFKGILPALILVSNPTIQYVAYERMKLIAKKKTGNDLTALQVFALGAIAKIVSTIITSPFLILKARLQASSHSSTRYTERYDGTLDCIQKIMKNEGIKGFYKGLNTKIVQSVLAAAILFMTKEKLVQYTQLFLFIMKIMIRKRFKKHKKI